jgi:hypothetical protein
MATQELERVDFMAVVLRLEEPRPVDDGAQADTAPQRTSAPDPHPFEHGRGTDHGLALGRGEAREVAQQPFVIAQLEAGRPAGGERGIDRRAQHGSATGHG